MSIEQNRQDNPYFGNKTHSPVTTYSLEKEPLSMNPIYTILSPSAFQPTDFNPLYSIRTTYGAYQPPEDCKDNPMCNYSIPSFTIDQNRKDNPYFGFK
jgi:hypothetical protein